MAASFASARRTGVLALAFSTSLRSNSRATSSAFQHSLRRAVIPVALSCTVLRSKVTSADDPAFANDTDYEELKRSRPMRIYARPLDPNKRSTNDHGTTGAPAVTKIVHFQRHGQGTHNEVYQRWSTRTGTPLDLSETDPTKNPLLTERVLDAPLTHKGREQCVAQQAATRELAGVELIVVSPLVRALQTAHITFADFLPVQRTGREVTWIVHEDVREELGLLLCNKRRPLSATMLEFPDMDYAYIPDHGEEDTAWSKHVARTSSGDAGTPNRETMVDMSHRAYRFLVDFLRTRPEQEIAVVGHSAWLFAMTKAVLDIREDHSAITPMFGQAEVRSMKLVFSEN